MFISKIKIQNFRLLQNTCFELDEEKKKDLSLLIGRNNSGKTSFVVLLEKFLGSGASNKFSFDDFSIHLRKQILAIEKSTNIHSISIKLFVEIQYTEDDSFESLADFILDLDPASNTVKLLFECSIDKKRLLRELVELQSRKPEFIKKNIAEFLNYDIYVFDKYNEIEEGDREELTKKEPHQIKKLINLQVVHAKRNVASSEADTQGQKVLSQLATKFFNKEHQLSHDESNQINTSILDMDATLDDKYDIHFTPLLANAKEFLNIDDLKVISDLQSKEIISNYAKIVYGSADQQLPESFNGLGHMNILYLLLDIEIRSSLFTSQKSDINLLFIEEPEAHTHPQMQYVFIDKIKKMLGQIENLQTIISTHSSHIVKKCDFEDIRYFLKDEQRNNVNIKNFHRELNELYRSDNPEEDIAEKAHFKFLKQYLTIGSSELFFAEKIIFIEGTTENLLIPYFINRLDIENKDNTEYTPLSSQNISMLEVGANAKAFRHFLEFLGIKTLIITDIDTTSLQPNKSGGKSYQACRVVDGENTSNATLKYFFDAPEIEHKIEFKSWIDALKINDVKTTCPRVIKVAYQIEDSNYQGRSFEDAFISRNVEKVRAKVTLLEGLKHTKDLDNPITDYYSLTARILKTKGKSDFASSVLFQALSDDEFDWHMPLYIKEGLTWIAQ